MFFINLITKARVYKKQKQKVQYILLVARQQTQGSSRLLSKYQITSPRFIRAKAGGDFKVRNSIFFFKNKKTHLSMSRGPIAKKKKSMITLGFKNRIHVASNSIFGPVKSVSDDKIKIRPYIKQLSNHRTSSMSVSVTKRMWCVV